MHVMYTKGYHVYVDDYDDACHVHTHIGYTLSTSHTT